MVTSGPVSIGLGGAPLPGGPDERGPGVQADNPELEALIESAENRWAAVSVDSITAGILELETGASVMAIGGFTGSDNSPTLEQFQQYVADDEVRYFIEGGGMGGPRGGNSGSAGDITSWVQQNFTAIDVGGTTVYDLAAPI